MNRRGAVGCGMIVPLFMGAIFATVGFCLILFLGWPVLQKAKASAEWPSTEGTVTDSEVIRSQDDDGVQYKPEVLYSYQVEEEDYQQSNIRYDGNWSTNSPTYANKTVKKYPVGKAVDVYYDPEDAFEAVLEPGTSWASYSLVAFGGVFFLIGAGIFLSTGGYLLFAIFISGGAATGMIGKPPSSQESNRDENPYANTDQWGDNKPNEFDENSNRQHDDGFENI